MQIETAIGILKNIEEGHDTVSSLMFHRKESSVSYSLKQAEKLGLIERDIKGKRKPYKLTKKGKEFLRVLSADK